MLITSMLLGSISLNVMGVDEENKINVIPSIVNVYTVPRYPIGGMWDTPSGTNGDIITVYAEIENADYACLKNGFTNRYSCSMGDAWTDMTNVGGNLWSFQLPGDYIQSWNVYEASYSEGSYVYFQIYAEDSATWDCSYYPDFDGDNDDWVVPDDVIHIYPAWPPQQINATSTLSKSTMFIGETFWVNGTSNYWNSTSYPNNFSKLLPADECPVSVKVGPNTFSGKTNIWGNYSIQATAPATPGSYTVNVTVSNATANRNVPCKAQESQINVLKNPNSPIETVNEKLIIALQSDMKSMNPWDPDTNDVWKTNQLQFNFEGLMANNPDYELYPLLAAEKADGTVDATITNGGMNINIKLRQGVTFTDGKPMTSKDVVFSYQTLAWGWGLFQNQILDALYWDDGTTFTKYNGGQTRIGVQANGTYAVDFYLTRPYAMFWYQTMTVPITPWHIWQNHSMAMGYFPGYDTSLETTWDYGYGSQVTQKDATIGTGPMYLDSWVKEQGSVIKPYANYWGKNMTTSWAGKEYPNYPQHVNEINFKIYTQLDLAILALQNGEVHHHPWSLTPGYYNQFKIDPNIDIETSKDQGLFYMSYNLRKAGINDVNFRRAIAYCVDKQYIVNELMDGNGIEGSVPISITNAFYVNNTVPAWIQGNNLAAAQALLDANGYTDKDGDGWRDMPDGSPIKFNILTPPKDYDPIRADSGIMIEKNLKSIGLNIASVPTSFDTIVSAAYVSLDFDMFILGWSVGSFPESYLKDFFHSSADVATNPSGSNAAGYHNATVDAMIDEMAITMDTDERVQLVKDICGATMMDVVYDTLYYRTNIEAYRSDAWVDWIPAFGSIYNRFSINVIHPPGYLSPSFGGLEVGFYTPETVHADANSTCYVLVTENDMPVGNAHVVIQTNFGATLDGYTNAQGNLEFGYHVPFLEGQAIFSVSVSKDSKTGGALKYSQIVSNKPFAQLSLSTDNGVITPSAQTVVTARVTDRDGNGIPGVDVHVDSKLMFGTVDSSVKITGSGGYAWFNYTAPPASMLPNTNRYEQFKASISVSNTVIPEVQKASLIIGIENDVRDWYQVDIDYVDEYIITGNPYGTLPTNSNVWVKVIDENNNAVANEIVYVDVDDSIAVPDALWKQTDSSGYVDFTITALDNSNSHSTIVSFSVNRAYSTTDSFLLLNHNETDPTGGYAADIDFNVMVGHQSTATVTATVWDETGAPAVGVPCQFFIPPTAEGIPGKFQGGDEWVWEEYGDEWDLGWWAGYIGSWYRDNATVTNGAGQLVATIDTSSFIADSVIPLQFGIGGYGVTDAFNFTANHWWMEDYGVNNWAPPMTENADGNYYWRAADFTLVDSGILLRAPVATMTQASMGTPYLSPNNPSANITMTFQNATGALFNSTVQISEGIAKPYLLDKGPTDGWGNRNYIYNATSRPFDAGIGFTSMVMDPNYSRFPFNFYIPYIVMPDELVVMVEPSSKLVQQFSMVEFVVTVLDDGSPVQFGNVTAGNQTYITDSYGQATIPIMMFGNGIQNTSFTASYNGMAGSMTAGVIVSAPLYAIPWFDDFESGLGDWSTEIINPSSNGPTEWEIGNPNGTGPGTAYSENNCAGTNIDSNYRTTGADITLTSPSIVLGSDLNIMTFYTWYNTRYGCQARDGGFVELNNGGGWTQIYPVGGYPDWGRMGNYWTDGFSGQSNGWEYYEFDLSGYSGDVIQVRFHFAVSQYCYDNQYPGWYVDDVYIGTPPDYRVSLTPETQTDSGNIGTSVDYWITVENTGLLDDTYSLWASGNSWDTRIYDATGSMEISDIFVQSGTSANVLVRTWVPGSAVAGEQDDATITAWSWNANVSDSATIITRVGAVLNQNTGIWYPTIQEAVDYASAGDTLWARNGTYHENVNVYKQLTIIGENRENTIIDGGGNGNVVYISSNEVSINEFTIKNSGAYWDYSGIKIDGDYCNIENNKIVENNRGVHIYSSYNRIFGNIMSNEWAGIQIDWSSNNNNTISNNTLLSNGEFGIVLSDSTGNIIDSNVITLTNEGIRLEGSSYKNMISNNSISTGQFAIRLRYYPHNNTISNNLIRYNHYGIRFEGERCNSNVITQNNILNNYYHGIFLSSWGSYPHQLNRITYNNILSNGDNGIYMGWGSQYNYIHHNNIADHNWRNAYDESGLNIWDDGYPSGGNYWGDYSGNDFYSGPNQDVPGFDGFGDTPYTNMQGNAPAQDRYPFMKSIPGCGPQTINDTAAPQYSNAFPSPGSIICNPTPTISVWLFDNSWVNESTIKLYINGYSVKTQKGLKSDGQNVYFNVSYTHTSGFTDGQIVTCRIVAKDIHGNAMEYTWQFTVDLAAPYVVSVTPSDSSAGVSRETSITVQFSEPMDHASAEAAFSISPPVSGYFTWSGNEMTFHPSTRLAANTTYLLSMTWDATDVAGNHLSPDYYWSFSTVPSSITIYHTTVSSAELGQTTTIACQVEVLWGNYATNCTLYYKGVGQSTYTSVPMILISGNAQYGTWSGTIPAQYSVGTVRYYIVAWDDSPESATHPATDAVTNPHQMSIIDTTAPWHSNELPPNGSTVTESVITVSVDITDLSAINTNSIELIINGFSVDYTLTLISGGYRVSYLQDMGFIDGSVQCRIIAQDVWGNALDWTWAFNVESVDVTPPSHSNEYPPISGQSGNLTPVISVDVTDLSGVNTSTVKLYVNGFMIAHTLTPIAGGYTVSYWHEGGFFEGQNVTCRIVAKDILGNTLDFTWHFTAVSQSSFVIPIHAGWNLISIPLVQDDTSVEVVLGSIAGQWNVIKYYDGITKTWKTYRIGSGIDHTMGFWLHALQNTTLTVYGQMPESTGIMLHAGWNLVGYPSMNANTTIADALFGTGYTAVEGYCPTSPYIMTLDNSYIMQPGEGYWVYVPADVMWTVSYHALPPNDLNEDIAGTSGTKGQGSAFSPEYRHDPMPQSHDNIEIESYDPNIVTDCARASSGMLPLFAMVMLLVSICLAVRKRRKY
jgi:parallel beta-helix repeat protein